MDADCKRLWLVHRDRALVSLFVILISITCSLRAADDFQSLRLRADECVETDGIKIKFKAVLEDSRCPEGAQCFSSGNAKVQLQITEPRASAKIMELNSQTPPVMISVDQHELKILNLLPYPRDGVSPKPDAYVLTLGIHKRSPAH